MNLKYFQKTNGKIKSGNQKLIWQCLRYEDTKGTKSLPSLSLIPLFSAALNKDGDGKKQSEENKEVRKCVSLALFNFKD